MVLISGLTLTLTPAIAELRGLKAHPSCQETNKPSAGAIVGFLHLHRSTNYPLKARLSPRDAWDGCEECIPQGQALQT